MISRLRRFFGGGDKVAQPGTKALSEDTATAPPPAAPTAAGLIAQGHAAEERGDMAAAEQCYRAAIAADAGSADAHMNLGNALNARGEVVAAVAAYERALALNPDHASAHYNLGLALFDGADAARGETHLRAAVRLREAFPQAWVALGLLRERSGDADAALDAYLRALHYQPDCAEALFNLAPLYRRRGQHQQAADCYVKALALRPGDADAHVNLGLIYKEHGEVGAATACYRRAQQLRPNDARALGELGNALQEQGEFDTAIDCYRRALALQPDYAAGHGNLLFTLNYHPDQSAEQIFEAYRDFDRRFGLPLRSTWRAHDNDRDPVRRLRVAYVSPDFNQHPVRYFLEPLLAHHDRERFEVFAFAELASEDAATARYRTYADRWMPTRGLSDEALAECIRAERIDILVDLAGHTANNRLGVFARKPAPVALSWLGYGYTTGLTAVDYLLTDAASAPAGSEHLFAERPLRVATPAYAYRPPEGMGEVGPLPASQRDGLVTFGTLTRSVRVNHRVIAAWAAVLQRVPRARLLIDSKNFLDVGLCQELAAKFAHHGIAAERLELGYHTPPWDVLRGFDIGLDCFPHNSGTTLFETLYMGVPFVSVAGRPSVGRLGSSILHGIGHPEWIATSEDEYIDKAVALAGDLDALAVLRAGLRAEMQASPLMDEAGFARKVEAAYRGMWNEWVATAPTPI